MRKTTQAILEDMLLDGKHVNKFDFLNATQSTCLAQRVYDIQWQRGWDIKSKTIKGKGTLTEYWLEDTEIKRIKSKMRETISLLPGGMNYDSRY